MNRLPRLSGLSRPSARQFWLALLCALCLLSIQGLGHWHGIAHGGAAGELPAQLSQLDGSGHKAGSPDGWGHQSGDADCHVFDHVSHEQWLIGAASLAIAALAHHLPSTPALAGAELAARWKRGARAPPLLA